MPTNILVVDDQSNMRSAVAYLLEKEGYRVTKAASGREALSLLEDRKFELSLIDIKMAQMDGLELLQRVRARWPDVAVIIMTAYASIPSAVDAVKMGASHYLEKPFTKDTLLEAIHHAQAEYGRGTTGAQRGGSSPFQEIVGNDPALLDAVELAQRSASNDKPILICGELGTGREALARAVHESSPRSGAPFVIARCSTAGDQLENELFGNADTSGRLIEANGGTLYLDEVGDAPTEVQGRLLRYLQDGEITRRGGDRPERVDVRIITSTAYDLQVLIDEQSFRHDLYLRLIAVQLRLPSLRDRRADLPRLLQHYARRHKMRGAPTVKFTRDAVNLLMKQSLLGNLTELERLVEGAIPLAQAGEVGPAELTRLGLADEDPGHQNGSAMRTRIEHEERKAIEEALKRNPRNLKQAAMDLNISRTTLWRKMKKYDLDAR